MRHVRHYHTIKFYLDFDLRPADDIKGAGEGFARDDLEAKPAARQRLPATFLPLLRKRPHVALATRNVFTTVKDMVAQRMPSVVVSPVIESLFHRHANPPPEALPKNGAAGGRQTNTVCYIQLCSHVEHASLLLKENNPIRVIAFHGQETVRKADRTLSDPTRHTERTARFRRSDSSLRNFVLHFFETSETKNTPRELFFFSGTGLWGHIASAILLPWTSVE